MCGGGGSSGGGGRDWRNRRGGSHSGRRRVASVTQGMTPLQQEVIRAVVLGRLVYQRQSLI